MILRETVHSSHRMASHNAPLEYTGRTMKASISSVYGYYNVDGIEKGFVVFGLADLTVTPQSCQNCKFRTGTNCKKNRQSTAIFDWCRAWKLVRSCN